MAKPCDHDSRPLYELLIEPLRAKARELGYALAVHGTLKRDIDLIACPWTNDAVDPAALAEALLVVAGTVNYIAFMTPIEGDDYSHRCGKPGDKPHGRLGWCFHLGGGPYIDLSVMPRTEPADPSWWYDDNHVWHPHPDDDVPKHQFREIGRTLQSRNA